MSSKNDKGKEPLVRIATAPNEMVASLWKDVLAENDIKCLMKSINLVASMYTSPITLQYEILVLASDAEKAREILTPFIEDESTPVIDGEGSLSNDEEDEDWHEELK
jgi:hypothetical protein